MSDERKQREAVDICPDCGGLRVMHERHVGMADSFSIQFDIDGNDWASFNGPVDVWFSAPVEPCEKARPAIPPYWYFADCVECDTALPFDNEAARETWLHDHIDGTRHRVMRYTTTTTGRRVK